MPDLAITPAAAFPALILMVLIWIACVRSLSRQLRERHPQKYEELDLANLWPQTLSGWIGGFDNSEPVLRMLRFLSRGEDRALRDLGISRLSAFMRCLFVVYLFLFGAFIFFFVTGDPSIQNMAPQRTAQTAAPGDSRRNEAFVLHRNNQWAEAIAAYDELLQESAGDAELHYWRGMARWHLDQTDLALEDFREVIQLEPTNFEAHRHADRILSQQRRWEEVLDMWNHYIERKPADAEAYFERGGTNHHMGKRSAAKADAVKACELGKPEACAMVKRL